MDEMAIAEKIAAELKISDAGYVYYYLVDLRDDYQDKYPGHRMLCIPGDSEMAVLPDGTMDAPGNVFGEDYPECRGMIIHGAAGC